MKEKSEHYFLGLKGENIAADFLKKQKYKMLTLNYKGVYGEIDIIAEDKKSLVFIEVKTRSSMNYGLPSESVDLKKQKRIAKVAEEYMEFNKKKYKEYRFDVVEIIYNKYQDKIEDINLIKDAFIIGDE